MTFTTENYASRIEAETCTEPLEEEQPGQVSMEHLYELQEANSRLRLLVFELLMKNQQLRFQRMDE